MEIVATNPPSARKLADAAAKGIDVFELDGKARPVESSVLKAHIAPGNCRHRRRVRLIQIWDTMRKDFGAWESLIRERPTNPPEAPQPAVAGVFEDFRNFENRMRDNNVAEAEMERRSQELREQENRGELNCARCHKPPDITDHSMNLYFITTHMADGSGCRQIPVCKECEFALTVGWDGTFPEDADEWGLQEDCPDCQSILSEHTPPDTGPTVEIPIHGDAFMLVSEPARKQQAYVVGRMNKSSSTSQRTVSKSELLATVSCWEYWINLCAHAMGGLTRREQEMLGEFRSVMDAVHLPNNIADWDFADAFREGNADLDRLARQHDQKQDTFVLLNHWMQTIPPCPLRQI